MVPRVKGSAPRPAIVGSPNPDPDAVQVEGGGEWDFHNVSTAEYLHRLHPYPAKFIPQIPRKAVAELSEPGDTVLDPFAGCGTTLLEASLLDRPSIGVDNNAVAALVSRAKTQEYSEADFKLLKAFAERLPDALSELEPRPDLVPENERFAYWFPEPVIDRLGSIKGLILGEPEPLQLLLLAALSSIVVRVSYQDSDTRYARVERDISAADVDTALLQKVGYLCKQLPTLIGRQRATATVHQADGRDLNFIEDREVRLIVTSPPYLNAYDYHKYHRQRLHLIGGENDVALARDLEIGKHDTFTRSGASPEPFFDDMSACFAEWARVLSPRGKALVVIGDAIVNKEPIAVGDRFVEIAGTHGLSLERRWIRELQGTRRSFNVRHGRISHEHVLLFASAS